MAVLLIADDDADLRTVFSVLFTRRGFTVLTATDGAHALRLARQHRPDVVLTDFDMPGMDGVQLCRALRDDPRLRTVPVALLSGSLAAGDPRTEADELRERTMREARAIAVLSHPNVVTLHDTGAGMVVRLTKKRP